MSRVLGQGVSGVGLDVGFLGQGWWPQPGGIESHTRALARGLAERGHRVHALCLEREDALAPYAVANEQREGVEVRRMGAPRELRALADLVHDARAIDVVLAWLAEVPCDVIHAHHLSGLGASALRAVADMGRPLVLTLHDHWLLCPCGQLLHDAADAAAARVCVAAHWPQLLPSGGGEPRGPEGEAVADDAAALAARTRYAREMLRLPHAIVAPAPNVLAAYASMGLDGGRTRVIEHGIDAAELRVAVDAERARASRPAGEPLHLGVLGAVLPAKGVVELMEAFVAADVPGLTLEVHGPLCSFHGDERHLQRARALTAGKERIRLHGAYRQDELPRILAGLDGVAAPALWDEVYGLTVREARAAGLPVLVSARGALPAATQGGAAGRVLPAGDRAAWSAALADFARDAAQRARWSATAHDLRDVRAMTRDYERLYAELALRVTGRLPDLAHAIEGLEQPPAGAEPRSAPSAGPSAPRPGLLRRLFGRG